MKSKNGGLLRMPALKGVSYSFGRLQQDVKNIRISTLNQIKFVSLHANYKCITECNYLETRIRLKNI